MATLFAISSQPVPAGFTITNQTITPPPGTAAITYDVTVGDLATPAAQDVDAWVEYNDGSGTWREISRFHAGASSRSIGRVPMRGTALRLSATCGQATIISVFAETSA